LQLSLTMKMFLQYLATNVPRLAKRSHDRTIKLAWSFIKVPLSPATWLKSPRFTSSPVQPIEVCLPIIPLPSETQKKIIYLYRSILFLYHTFRNRPPCKQKIKCRVIKINCTLLSWFGTSTSVTGSLKKVQVTRPSSIFHDTSDSP